MLNITALLDKFISLNLDSCGLIKQKLSNKCISLLLFLKFFTSLKNSYRISLIYILIEFTPISSSHLFSSTFFFSQFMYSFVFNLLSSFSSNNMCMSVEHFTGAWIASQELYLWRKLAFPFLTCVDFQQLHSKCQDCVSIVAFSDEIFFFFWLDLAQDLCGYLYNTCATIVDNLVDFIIIKSLSFYSYYFLLLYWLNGNSVFSLLQLALFSFNIYLKLRNFTPISS